jgi:DNA polymerase elongation subunit (family B)
MFVEALAFTTKRHKFMGTVSIRLYDMFRKNLKLQESEARDLVEAMQDMAKTEQVEKYQHIEQMVQKDIQSLKVYMDHRFDSIEKRFATKEDLSSLRTELSRTIYLTSLGQLLAIVASVVSIVMILKK